MSLFTGSVEQKFYDDTFDKMLKKIYIFNDVIKIHKRENPIPNL